MRARLSLLLAALATACTAGPDYRLPESAVARRPAAAAPFVGGDEPAFAAGQPLPNQWWRLYEDPRLNGFVEQALAANTDLRAADANLRAAAAVVREAQAGRTLQSTLGGGASLARPDQLGGSLPGTIGYDLGATLAYPLDLAGRIRRGIEAARADEETAIAARDVARVAVVAGVVRSYASACAANVELAANSRVLAVQRQTLDVTQRLQRGGRGTAFDVTRARAAAEASEAAIPDILASRRTAALALTALLGRVPAEAPAGIETCEALPTVPRAIPIGDGAALIRRRADIRQSERALAAATARIGVATADLYPDISLGGSAGFTGPLSAFGSGNAFRLSLGPLVSWTFPNRRAVRARIEAAGADADAALARFDGSVLFALRDTESALTAYAREIDRAAALARARDSAATAAGQAARLYRFGRTDFLSLLTAQANLAASERDLADAQASVTARQVDLFEALGGGWQ